MRQPPATAVPPQIFITSYWPRLQADGENIGYGVSRNDILHRALSSPLLRLSIFLIEPRTRMRIPWFICRLMLTLPTILLRSLMVARGLLSNGRGYYVIDDEGKALSFLGGQVPESINGRIGMGRKKFLRLLNN